MERKMVVSSHELSQLTKLQQKNLQLVIAAVDKKILQVAGSDYYEVYFGRIATKGSLGKVNENVFANRPWLNDELIQLYKNAGWKYVTVFNHKREGVSDDYTLYLSMKRPLHQMSKQGYKREHIAGDELAKQEMQTD